MTRIVSESTIQGDMIRMPLGDEGFAFYPYKFAWDAINRKKFSIFVTKGTTQEDASVMLVTLPDGTNTVIAGEYEILIRKLLEIPWKEDRVGTSEGPMYRKLAPSLYELKKMIIRIRKEVEPLP